uniref:CAAX prenyl protease 2/Lysostaphin resistance protein A-like domain-containing protein n=1 Tax=Manihot esculenta TaxID=3983 RepID=A0A2C9USU0_MANES
MPFCTTTCLTTTRSCSWMLTSFCDSPKILPAKSSSGNRFCTRTFARQKSVKKLRRDVQSPNRMALKSTRKSLEDENKILSDGSSLESNNNVEVMQNSLNFPSRSAVLQACTVTSGAIAALGILIRQVSHVASVEGLPILDCSTEVSFGTEMWHLELITGLVMLISLCRYFLLKTWPDFAESTEAANQQVLTSLQPLDYVVVSFLPGISEELLFRGALLPLFGMDSKSALLVAVVFGVLHLGGGRKYSFAVWATFVGLAYGYATIVSSSVIVPMASHALNNLVGGILWSSTSKLSKTVE